MALSWDFELPHSQIHQVSYDFGSFWSPGPKADFETHLVLDNTGTSVDKLRLYVMRRSDIPTHPLTLDSPSVDCELGLDPLAWDGHQQNILGVLQGLDNGNRIARSGTFTDDMLGVGNDVGECRRGAK